MSLRSQLFSGDAALESAAVSDPAHITPGARGEHVRKIQLALNQLDHASLTPDGAYGSDPRKPEVGLAPKSVQNICCRNSPVHQVTIDEIERVAAPGCRVTFAGDRGFAETLRRKFVDAGGATLRDEGPCGGGFGGFGIIFELR